MNAQDWQAALNLMKTHQMIELPGAILNVEDQTPIYLYSTINLYVTASDMNALIEEYKEEAANETIEEDIYPDGDQ